MVLCKGGQCGELRGNEWISGRLPGIFHIHTHTHGNPWPLNTAEQEQCAKMYMIFWRQLSLDLSKEFCNFAWTFLKNFV